MVALTLLKKAISHYTIMRLPDLILDRIGRQKHVQSSLSKMSRQRAQQLASEFLAELGFHVVAFDISSTAISECKRRFQHSQVSYQVEDLLNPSNSWFQGLGLTH